MREIDPNNPQCYVYTCKSSEGLGKMASGVMYCELCRKLDEQYIKTCVNRTGTQACDDDFIQFREGALFAMAQQWKPAHISTARSIYPEEG